MVKSYLLVGLLIATTPITYSASIAPGEMRLNSFVEFCVQLFKRLGYFAFTEDEKVAMLCQLTDYAKDAGYPSDHGILNMMTAMVFSHNVAQKTRAVARQYVFDETATKIAQSFGNNAKLEWEKDRNVADYVGRSLENRVKNAVKNSAYDAQRHTWPY
jgi:hypothetical protein